MAGCGLNRHNVRESPESLFQGILVFSGLFLFYPPMEVIWLMGMSLGRRVPRE